MGNDEEMKEYGEEVLLFSMGLIMLLTKLPMLLKNSTA